MHRLLHLLYLHNRPIRPRNVYGPLADDMALTQEQRTARLKDMRLASNNRVQYARWALVKLRWLDDSRRGFWSLTPNGRQKAAELERSAVPLDLESLL